MTQPAPEVPPVRPRVTLRDRLYPLIGLGIAIVTMASAQLPWVLSEAPTALVPERLGDALWLGYRDAGDRAIVSSLLLVLVLFQGWVAIRPSARWTMPWRIALSLLAAAWASLSIVEVGRVPGASTQDALGVAPWSVLVGCAALISLVLLDRGSVPIAYALDAASERAFAQHRDLTAISRMRQALVMMTRLRGTDDAQTIDLAYQYAAMLFQIGDYTAANRLADRLEPVVLRSAGAQHQAVQRRLRAELQRVSEPIPPAVPPIQIPPA